MAAVYKEMLKRIFEPYDRNIWPVMASTPAHARLYHWINDFVLARASLGQDNIEAKEDVAKRCMLALMRILIEIFYIMEEDQS